MDESQQGEEVMGIGHSSLALLNQDPPTLPAHVALLAVVIFVIVILFAYLF